MLHVIGSWLRSALVTQNQAASAGGRFVTNHFNSLLAGCDLFH